MMGKRKRKRNMVGVRRGASMKLKARLKAVEASGFRSIDAMLESVSV